MMKDIQIGSAKSKPGKLTFGFIDGIELPTGTIEKIPVMIAQGTEDGPTFFLTANVHGNELTGIAVIHEVVTEDLAAKLKGTVVAIPTLNPSALRQSKRQSQFGEVDPNRLYPEGRFVKDEEVEEVDKEALKPYEQVASKVFSYLEKYADYHIDFHNHSIRSIPYSILDRIFYKDDSEKDEAQKLSEQQEGMVKAFGVMYTADFPAKKYMRLKYHRSVSGAVLNSLRIPAFTVELGSNTILVPEVVSGSIKGTLNVLKWAGMLEGQIEEITEFDIPKPEHRLRRVEHPLAKQSGIIRLLVQPGEKVTKGQPIAKITDIHGRPRGDGFIRTDYDGYMIALRSEPAVYPYSIVSEMGIKDEESILSPMPE